MTRFLPTLVVGERFVKLESLFVAMLGDQPGKRLVLQDFFDLFECLNIKLHGNLSIPMVYNIVFFSSNITISPSLIVREIVFLGDGTEIAFNERRTNRRSDSIRGSLRDNDDRSGDRSRDSRAAGRRA